MKTNRTQSSGFATSKARATSRPGSSMTEASPRSSPRTSKASGKRTSSPGSAGGHTPSGSRGGQTTSRSGPGAAPANRSRRAGNKEASKTSGTSGLHGSGSSKSAALQSSLESRLRALTASGGSTLFSLTWKERVTPAGRVICALRASVPRTSGNVCTSWPSPLAVDANGERAYSYNRGDHNSPAVSLNGAARLASWATPAARDYRSDRGQKSDSEQYGSKGRPLPRQALLLDSGKTPSGGPAGTVKHALLNPAHSRWLIGLPPAWDACAPSAMPSSRRKRPSSSEPR